MRRQRIARLIIVVLIGLIVGLLAFWYSLQPRANSNALALGENGAEGTLTLEIAAPAEFDFLPREQIMALRTQAVMRYPMLLGAEYTPSDQVFRQVESGLPWWGLIGQFFYDRGEGSIVGDSEESRFVLNPYLLAAPNTYWLRLTKPDGAEWAWADASIADADRERVPTDCLPASLTWTPRERHGEAVYDLTACTRTVSDFLDVPMQFSRIAFDLIAYNAVDFNLSYVYAPVSQATHITQDEPATAAYRNPQFIHQGGSCGYPGGCNNMSPATPPISSYEVTGLPAELPVYFWRDLPAAVTNTPDFVFTLIFR